MFIMTIRLRESLEIIIIGLICSDVNLILSCKNQCYSSSYQLLILDVYNKYSVSGVILLSFQSDDMFGQIIFLRTTIKYLSDHTIISTSVKINDLENEVKFFKNQIGRPMIIVLLEKIETLKSFGIWCQKLDMRYPVWLILSTGLQSVEMDNYYENLNIFSLTLKTEMLVWYCHKPKYIYEWWSTSGNYTERRLWGNWNRITGIVLTNNNSLYARRNSVHGLSLRIVYAKGSTFFSVVNSKLVGYMGEFLTELQYALNFSCSTFIGVDQFGLWNNQEKKWTGMIGAIAREEADLGVGELLMTNDRSKIVDFTLPLYITPCRLYFKQPDDRAVHWSAYFEAFATEIWIAILIIIMIAPPILTSMQVTMDTKSFSHFILDNYLSVWGIFCQQSLSEFPSKMSLAIAYFSIFISAIILSATYSAALISYLAISNPPIPFHSIEEFVVDGTYQLSVLKDGANYDLFNHAKEPIMKKLKRMMIPRKSLPQTNNDGFLQVCRKKVAFYASEAIRKSITVQLPCEVAYIETGKIDSLAMVLPLNSSYTGLINYYINRFRDAGVLRRLKRKYFTKPTAINDLNTNDALDLQGAMPVFLVIVGGLCISALIIIFEKLYFFHYNGFFHKFNHSNNLEKLNAMNNLQKSQCKNSFISINMKKFQQKPNTQKEIFQSKH